MDEISCHGFYLLLTGGSLVARSGETLPGGDGLDGAEKQKPLSYIMDEISCHGFYSLSTVRSACVRSGYTIPIGGTL